MNILVKFNDGIEQEYNQFAVHFNEFEEKVLLVPLDDERFKIASDKANDNYYSVLYFDTIQSIEVELSLSTLCFNN
jgi:hypothetical protein